MEIHVSHQWVGKGEDVFCYHCSSRAYWPLAEAVCRGRRISPGKWLKEGYTPIACCELSGELGKALAAVGSGMYAIFGPSRDFGRDGRKRTGI